MINSLRFSKKKTRKDQKSINQLLLDTLKNSLGLSSRKKLIVEFQDLDHLFGQWSEEEYEKTQGKVTKERQIDRELCSGNDEDTH